MVLFFIVGLIVLLALVVLGFLFFMLSKEGQKPDEKAVPMTDITQIKKEFSSSLLEQSSPKPEHQPEVLPAFEPQAAMPTGPAVMPPADDEYKKRAEELEVELKAISLKAESQVQEAQQMIDNLSEENESLKRQKAGLEEAQGKLAQLQSEADGLKSQNTGLQAQLEEGAAKVRLLEEQMAAYKVQMGEEIAKANAAVTQLTQEKEILSAQPQPQADPGLSQELETLKSQQQELKQKYDDLQKEHQQLRELNVHMAEKNDQLQYEMVKARAQSSGLERMTFNYKNQIEDFLKQISVFQMANDQLTQTKARLESALEEAKQENEDLVKKDQLSQFELEKNRSRLAGLERDIEELKMRAGQKDS